MRDTNMYKFAGELMEDMANILMELEKYEIPKFTPPEKPKFNYTIKWSEE